MSITAMKQALEDFMRIRHHFDTDEYAWEIADNAITALRTAIEQAEKQEPFGYFQYAMHFDAWVQNRDSNKGVAFYTTPPAAPVQEPVKLRRGDVLRCIETDELCTVWATSTTHKTLVKWGGNDFSDYTAEQIGELFWLEPESSDVEIAAEQSDNYAAFHAGVRFAIAHLFTTPKQENVEIDWPDYHEQGMGCGLEDRGITDRYEAMRYGWDEALDRAQEAVNLLGPLYTTPPAQRQWVGLTDEQCKALVDARNEAMTWAAKGRIPECGAFAGIAQNLDWLCDQFAIEAKLREKNGGQA